MHRILQRRRSANQDNRIYSMQQAQLPHQPLGSTLAAAAVPIVGFDDALHYAVADDVAWGEARDADTLG